MKLGSRILSLFFIIIFSFINLSQASEIVEVCPNPYGSDGVEYVKLKVDKPCILSDEEGEIKINKTGLIVIAKNSTEFYNTFSYLPNYEFSKRFALSNSGESIFLIENGKVVDEFTYGKNGLNYLDDGVIYFKKDGVWDFRYQDWSDFDVVKDFVEGKIIITPYSYKFDCSENEKVTIASYTFTNFEMLENLRNIEIYVDATPVGGIPVEEMEIAKNYDVYFLNSDSYKNFHYKFGLCKNKVVITTENWVWDNRGYIVEFESEKVAKLLREILEYDKAYNATPGKIGNIKGVKKFENGKEFNFEGHVEVFVIPDENPIFDIISNAKSRLYIQAPYIDFKWYNGTPLLDSIKKAAKRAEVKILLDSKYNKNRNLDTAEFLNRIAKIENLNIEVKLVELKGFNSLHGKLIIADDEVVITSANFNMYGFKLNREIGIIIYSKEVSDFLANQFLEDFGNNKEKSALKPKLGYVELIPSLILLLIALFIVFKVLKERF
ncbi:hypothetical protein DRO97_05930 [Archaeoglobales archaeon]|nr:MAG: hypothetical protein DRO97_05930 [Archaeoglobales archaeon]